MVLKFLKLLVLYKKNVKDTVETMTGLNVMEVNVNVQGVKIPKEPKTEIEPRVK